MNFDTSCNETETENRYVFRHVGRPVKAVRGGGCVRNEKENEKSAITSRDCAGIEIPDCRCGNQLG